MSVAPASTAGRGAAGGRRATAGRRFATCRTRSVGSGRRWGRHSIAPRATCAGTTEVAAFTRGELDRNRCVGLIVARDEHLEQRRVAVARGVRAVGALLLGLLDLALHRIRIELGLAPDLWRRHGAELVFVKRKCLQVLGAEHLVLLVERDELGGVVEVPADHALAELAVAAGEELVLVPNDVDHLRRRDVVVADGTEVDELLVLADCQEGELLFPAVLPRDLCRKGASERVGLTECSLDLVDQARLHKVLEAVLAQTNPECFLHLVSSVVG